MSATLGSLISQLRARLEHPRLRAPRRGRTGVLERVEQRGHRPRRPVRAELHARERRRHRERRQGRLDQRAVPGQPSVLGVPRLDRCAARAAQLHQRDAAHDVRQGRGEHRVPQEARRGPEARAPVPRHGVHRGPRAHRGVDPAPREEAQPQAEGRGDAGRVRHRRRLRRAHEVPVPRPGASRRVGPDEPPGHLAQAPEGRHVEAPRAPPRRADPEGRARQVRVRRRRRWRARAAAALRHPRDQGLRRLPDLGPVPPHDEPEGRRAAPGEGLRQGRRRRSADVGAAPRHPRRRGRDRTPLRPLRGVHAEVPEVDRPGSTCRSRSGCTTSARCCRSGSRTSTS